MKPSTHTITTERPRSNLSISIPIRGEVRTSARSSDSVIAEICFPPGTYEQIGHYPSTPIVPAISLMEAASRSTRQMFPDIIGTLCELRKGRFVAAAKPGRTLTISATVSRSEDKHLVVTRVEDDGRTLCSFTLVYTDTMPQVEDPLTVTHYDVPVGTPSIEELVPHRPPMLLIDRILSLRQNHAVASTLALPLSETAGAATNDAVMLLTFEAWAQTGCALVGLASDYRDRFDSTVPVIGRFSGVRFFGRRDSTPSVQRTTLHHTVEMKSIPGTHHSALSGISSVPLGTVMEVDMALVSVIALTAV